MQFVLDASITVSWLLVDEYDPRAATALEWLKRDQGVVPQLWHFEVRNAMLIAERRGRSNRARTLESLDYLRRLPIVTDRQPDLEVALNLARMHGLSFYDAMYLELAKRRDVTLATLDSALARAALDEGLAAPRY